MLKRVSKNVHEKVTFGVEGLSMKRTGPYTLIILLLGELVMPIVDRINRDLTEAMKAKEVERLSAIRMVKTALKLRETELPGAVDDTEAIKVLNTLLKQRRDAAEQYRAGGREELALKEENEARIIQTY